MGRLLCLLQNGVRGELAILDRDVYSAEVIFSRNALLI